MTPLVINSLEGGHIHTHRRPHKNHFKKPCMRQPQDSAPGLKSGIGPSLAS